MANHLDLEEQEQLDQIKHYWKQYGNLLTWVAILILGGLASWNGYQYWQGRQATQAAAMLDEVEKIVQSSDAPKAERAFGDMRERFAGTAYTQQAALMVGKMLYEAGKVDGARATLAWASEHASDPGYAAVARLRLASILVGERAWDEALKTLAAVTGEEFSALVADRRGDIFMLQDKRQDAVAEFTKAYKALDERTEYRRLVSVKLNALGVNLAEDAPGAVAGSGGSK
jgi:predicted negative regulator of RcsB-dependent stress response